MAHELGNAVLMPVCGVNPGDNLQLRVVYPNGREATISDTAYADWLGRGEYLFEFHPTLEDPTGNYRFYASGPTGSASQVYSFIRPVQPRVYWPGDGRLLLVNYRPGEKVRVVAYTNWTFNGWQEFTIDRSGRLELRTDFPTNTVIVISRNTPDNPMAVFNDLGVYMIGKAIDSITGVSSPSDETQPAADCNAPQPAHLGVGGGAYVVADDLTIYKSPSRGAPVVRRIDSQARMTVVDGPVCAEGFLWWRVVTPKGYDGWIIEGDANGYYVNPGQ
jgi:hypothetical protein